MAAVLLPAPPKLPDIDDAKLVEWDPGAFNTEIDRLHIFPESQPQDKDKLEQGKDATIDEGTIDGTKIAITHMFQRIEKR